MLVWAFRFGNSLEVFVDGGCFLSVFCQSFVGIATFKLNVSSRYTGHSNSMRNE